MHAKIKSLLNKAETLMHHADRHELRAARNGTRDLPETSLRLALWRRAEHRARTEAAALIRSIS